MGMSRTVRKNAQNNSKSEISHTLYMNFITIVSISSLGIVCWNGFYM